MGIPNIITISISQESEGAQAFRDALKKHGYHVHFNRLTNAIKDTVPIIKIDRCLPPYDLPSTQWEGTWWNRPDHAWVAWSKTLTALTCSQNNLPTVPTIANDEFNWETSTENEPEYRMRERAENIVKHFNGFPLVMKPDRRFGGNNITFIKTMDELITNMEKRTLNVIQPYIPEARSTERVIIAGETVIARYTRTAPPSDWRANVLLGSIITPGELNDNVTMLALHAMKIFKLQFAGVDIINTPSGPLLLEMNPAFGITGLQRLTNGSGVQKTIDTLLTQTALLTM